MTTFNSNAGKSFIDLNASVCGNLLRIREVEVSGKNGRKGKAYFACTIKAFHGNPNNPNYTFIDLTIPAAEALEFVKAQKAKVDNKEDVFVKAWIGDLRAESYERDSRTSAQRETVATIKGRLLKIESFSRKEACVGGQYVLQVRGIAYLNQLFAPKGEKTTWLAGLSAMHGSFDEMAYTPFRLSAGTAGELGELLSAFKPMFDDNFKLDRDQRKKVTVAFKAENVLANIYHRKAQEGETGDVAVPQIVGDLSSITRIKLGDDVVYRLVKIGEGDEVEYEAETCLDLKKTGTDN